MLCRWIGFVMLVILTLSSCEYNVPYAFSKKTKMIAADSIQFADPHYDDSKWQKYISRDLVKSVHWTRIPIVVSDTFQRNEMAIKIVSTSTYDLYWDGEYIGSNRAIADENTAGSYGQYIKAYPLSPDHLQTTHHIVALRSISDAPNMEIYHSYAIVTTLDSAIAGSVRFSLILFVLAGVFLAVGITFGISYLYDPKDLSSILFSIICMTVLALLLLEYVKHTYGYAYPFQETRMRWINTLHIALTLLVPFFLMVQFEVKRKWIVLVVVFLIALIINEEDSLDKAAMMQNQLMWVTSMALMIYAIINKRQESLVLIVALILSHIAHFIARRHWFHYVSSYDVSLFVEYLIISLAMVYLSLDRRKKMRLAYEESLLTSERLRSELLRKNIRPHFIMNTLTSLMDWIEESPQQGVQFIKSLASEFRLLNDMADEKLVNIQDEIDLCKNHLEVMGYRKDIKYIWQEENIHYNEMLPPAILLTMVENGVTHSHAEGLTKVSFKLRYAVEDKWKTYTLSVHTDIPSNTKSHPKKESTGTRYITSRLRESYGEDWIYSADVVGDDWVNTLKIKR